MGDTSEESNWDFLVLSNTNEVEVFASILRREIKIQVEMVYDFVLQKRIPSLLVFFTNKSPCPAGVSLLSKKASGKELRHS